MVEKLDADVGRVLRAVEARNDNTLIIFTADHGEGAGRHGRNGKGTPWDWALKVPLIVWGPNLGVRHRVDLASLASGVDIMATVCDYAGAPPPPRCQGMSLRPLLEGAKAPWRQALYAETAMTACHILRDERFKLAMMYRYSGSYDQPFLLAEGEKTQFLPAAPDRLAKDDPLSWMLYDMKEDPWEMRNLAADPAYRGVLETMLAQLAEEHESRLIPGQRFDRN
ncbi:MAG: Arylsulfatase [candidate division BRC1 bacterium ADurb.BinA364]|nr:MAG: Arylsulfatase [candidate division BRC1 bacterium ADurb.BinA364]